MFFWRPPEPSSRGPLWKPVVWVCSARLKDLSWFPAGLASDKAAKTAPHSPPFTSSLSAKRSAVSFGLCGSCVWFGPHHVSPLDASVARTLINIAVPSRDDATPSWSKSKRGGGWTFCSASCDCLVVSPVQSKHIFISSLCFCISGASREIFACFCPAVHLEWVIIN